MKAGTKVTVRCIGRLDGVLQETATIARTMPNMIPLPEGYIPVRFDADGARLLVHREKIKLAA